MVEIAPGGGTLMIDMSDEQVITATLVSLASEPKLLERLAAKAGLGSLTSWSDYAAAVIIILDGLDASREARASSY